ncbi:aspartic proteinase precursor, partial [Decorospora gaudefroyi]
MRSSILSCAFIAFSAHTVHALNRRAPAHIAVTDNVLNLTTVPYAPHLLPPSSRHLLHRRDALSQAKRQFDPVASLDEPLVTLGGRIYMTDVTLGGQTYSLVIDTGSSDTWVVSSTFQCINPSTYSIIDTRYCGLASTYDPAKSSTWKSIPGYEFAVNYTGGEFLSGDLGTEVFGIGGISTGGSNGELQVRQTIGVVERGYWAGEGISSGLMGLAYPALVSGASRLKYQSVMFTLAKESPGPDIFSLAFNRPTPSNPSAGGQLAIGGIPNVSHDGNWVRVPIQPVAQDIYAYYSINIDGFDITTPPST